MKILKGFLCITLLIYIAIIIVFHFNDTTHFLDSKINSTVNISISNDGYFKIENRYIYTDGTKNYIYVLESLNNDLYSQKSCRKYEIIQIGSSYKLLNQTFTKFTAVYLDITFPHRSHYNLY